MLNLRFKYKKEILELKEEKYVHGGQALIAYCKNGEIFTTLSVRLDIKPSKNCFWFKTYSENEDISKFMLAEGLIELTGRTIQQGFVEIPEARIMPEKFKY